MIISGALLILLLTVIEGTLPPYFEKCSTTDVELNECLTWSANHGWSEFIKGDPNYYLIPLKPLEKVSLYVNINDVLKGNLIDGTISGLEGIHFESIKLNLANKRFDIKFTEPIFNIFGMYNISGALFGKPIFGNGITNSTYYEGTYHYFFEYDLKPKNERTYIQIKASGLRMDERKIHYQFDNLFDGDARLGKQMNSFLNDNWYSVHEFSKGAIGEAVGKIYTTVLSEFFKKVSMEDLF